MPKPPLVPEEAPNERRQVDFKEAFEVGQAGDWCEVIKDIVAMANSGGGALVIGVKNDGTPSGYDVAPLLGLDTAKVVDKIAMYTGEQFDGFAIRPGQRKGKPVAVIEVQGVFPPMVFARAGTYEVPKPGGKREPKIAFGLGTVYFRHGAKSEPTNSHDLKYAFERRLAIERKALLSNVSKVVQMGPGEQVILVPEGLAKSGDPRAVPVRLVNDPAATPVRALDPSESHPFRQKELVAEVNKNLAGQQQIRGHDIQCVRRAHNLDQNPTYSYLPKFGSRQYSEAFRDWLLGEYAKDKEFFTKARQAASANTPPAEGEK